MSIPLLVLQWPTMKKDAEPEVVSAIEEEETWMTPIINYIENDILPEDHGKSQKIRRQAARYRISQKKLYRRSFSGPYLRCRTPREAARILVELYEGECGSHSSSQILHFPREIILKVLSRLLGSKTVAMKLTSKFPQNTSMSFRNKSCSVKRTSQRMFPR